MFSSWAGSAGRRRERRAAARAAAVRAEQEARGARARRRLDLVGGRTVPTPRPVDTAAARRDPATRAFAVADMSWADDPVGGGPAPGIFRR